MMFVWKEVIKKKIGKGEENAIDRTLVPQKVMDLQGKKVVSLVAGKSFVSLFTGFVEFLFRNKTA